MLKVGKVSCLLLIVFFLALVLRLIYFPENVYFASDQARDAYYSYQIMQGDFRVVGPGATFGRYLHHGVLYYYVMGPIYYLFQGNPYIPALIINLLSAMGVFVVFLIGKNMFNARTAFIASFLYAISFEQSQYALFFGHPGLALVFVLGYYFGLTRLIFKGDSRGIILSAFCAGVATQLHVSLVILVFLIPVFVLVFRTKITNLKIRDIFWALVALGVSLSSFAVSELKFGHLRLFWASLGETGDAGFRFNFSNLVFAVNRYVSDNLITFSLRPFWGMLLVAAIFSMLIRRTKKKAAGVFLLMWFLAGCIAYAFGSSTTYYYGIGGSVALLIAVASLISMTWKRKRLFAILVLVVIFGSNVFKNLTINKKGPTGAVMAPPGLLLSDELRAIDFIYAQAGQEEFSIHGLTIPYNVKTTWDYLFNWYGMQTYGFVPVWGGEDALGSEGTLNVIRARSTLPSKQFLIIEPLSGLSDEVVSNFFREESYFTNLREEKKFGEITVQIREKY
ncbi:hypothetical protein A2382_04940 [Candidatus Woesebacteria bacterium RIFOXYB1_FULL_38_16]|uniref:Glycosyltransferase RgtA/B/C/D-like domain-containing protein n=1 Tax=Candidatus Woesebacteria bacterium RIFOXYB1_FULL_38_16 TaxID=1802538 RepID=A0A1F8CUK2_9BACT|nr:MAG: hypothetical protein A2191_00220 [Candidatus Woesebacteria bacterium RIFOXYA1_FULL_38_9]OGM80004.1 MAG: hypothetical protein A2382_04940 [Candidatus Woesebacteria bacterium RIFOXYB1_FULL_38_16]